MILCHQYKIRQQNLEKDLLALDLSTEKVESLKCKDFRFALIYSLNEKLKARNFIIENEWLGNLTQLSTHYFGAYYKDTLAGVLVYSVPNAFSKLLGEDTPQLERLLSRGACASWTPKNLASSLIIWSIKWLVQNTSFRLFTCYGDVEAGELGTIYQACGFYYLGQSAGTTKRYVNPYTGKVVSDRFFRQKTAYKKYANELGIVWEKNWNHSTGMSWENIPDDIEAKLRQASKDKQASSTLIEQPSKHKYAYVLGNDKRETRKLRKLFLERNKVYAYPKERGK